MITVHTARNTTKRSRQRRRRGRGSVFDDYGGGEEMPLKGYAALLAMYPAVFGAMFAAVARREGSPEKAPIGDIALLGIATHKIARLITKDWVTSPIRAPFTEYKESAGAGEVVEQSRGTGLRRAAGDLLTCPWCTGAWVAGALGLGYFLAPRLTRTVATVFTVEAIADFLHIGYDAAQKLRE